MRPSWRSTRNQARARYRRLRAKQRRAEMRALEADIRRVYRLRHEASKEAAA